MNKKLVINASVSETRVALVEDDRVAELYIERLSRRSMVGDIYKARVSRVLPGMQSAFVNIGSDRSGFLYGGDVIDPGFIAMIKEKRDSGDETFDPRDSSNRTPIQHLLQEGQDILVQVAKEPLGTKGPRVTMMLSVPGRYLVLLPDFDNIGISRRIEDPEKRSRLKEEIEKIKPANVGVIVRTAAAEVDASLLRKDLEYLIRVWESLKEKHLRTPAPALLYQEPDIILKTTRDLYTDDVSEIVIDDPQSYGQLKHFLSGTIPSGGDKLKLYQGRDPIFDAYGIEMDLAKALSRKVWLPSGGYLIIDQTEALTSFDVNTGKFVGTTSVQDTILKTNLESVTEIVAQLRIRNLGGIIVIDFIDMERGEDRERVNMALGEALKLDKSPTNVLSINELGLVQMTRKRTRESLERVVTEECSFCDGWGRVPTMQTETYNMVRDVERYVIRTGAKDVRIRVRSDILDWFINEEVQLHQGLIDKYGLTLHFEKGSLQVKDLHESPYEVVQD